MTPANPIYPSWIYFHVTVERTQCTVCSQTPVDYRLTVPSLQES